MLKRFGFGSLALAAIATISSLVLAAGNQDFTLHNETDFNIGELHISASDDNKWGPDVLGQDVLLKGDKTHITFTGFKDTDCKFDVKISKNGEDTAYVVEDLNLCEIDDVVFYSKDGKVFFRKQ